jgi:lysozyme
MASETLKGLIRRFEGLRLSAYQCPAGVWTCGYGSTGKDVVAGVKWTVDYAEQRMSDDAEYYERAAAKLCPSLRGDSLAAIGDFAYNLGVTRLAASTLRRKINSGDLDGARIELAKWVRGGGKILPGLVIRRNVEAALLK